jgi:CubicO group peptidase (beta-lactamase class C family)
MAKLDKDVRRLMAAAKVEGLGVALIENGSVVSVRTYGLANVAENQPMQRDTIIYGASLTKAAFAYMCMQLVDAGVLDLDKPIGEYLKKPLPEYDNYKDLANDPRWRRITPRMCLTHSTGFDNFWFIEPDHKLHIHFEPGTRFSYSGEGMILLQFVIENGSKDKGLALDVGKLTQVNFDRFKMSRTSLQWRSDFRPNLADGFNDKGEAVPHDQRSKVRAAGSMDTTIADLSKFVAALTRHEGLSKASYAEMLRPQLHIGTATQFPTLAPDLPADRQRKDLYAGLGVVLFDGPEGPGFYKGGHDSQTANTMVCIEKSRDCVLILSNDVRAEAGFGKLVKFILGDTGVPYQWEYGNYAGRS